MKDFDIKEAAGGVGKGITKEFDVDVNDNTLEIHLYWAGKGTTSIPNRGVYGPLISAITVTPSKLFFHIISCFHIFLLTTLYVMFYKHLYFVVDFEIHSKGLSAGAIVGIVAASCVLIIVVLVALRKMGFLGRKDTTDKGKSLIYEAPTQPQKRTHKHWF